MQTERRKNRVAFFSENVQEAGIRGRGEVRRVRDEDRDEDDDVADEVAEVADLEDHEPRSIQASRRR